MNIFQLFFFKKPFKNLCTFTDKFELKIFIINKNKVYVVCKKLKNKLLTFLVIIFIKDLFRSFINFEYIFGPIFILRNFVLFLLLTFAKT